MSIHRRIRQAREQAGLTQSDVARELGVTPQAVQLWESDDPETATAPRGKRIEALATLLNQSPVWVQFGHQGTESPHANTVPGPQIRRANVPLISWVRAGVWHDIEDPYVVGDAEEWLPIPKRCGSRTFALRVRGESMRNANGKPTYEDGDIIFVDPDVEPKNRDRVIVRLDNEKEATFKQLIVEGERRYLKALNPAWPEPFIEINNDATIVGTVIGRWSD